MSDIDEQRQTGRRRPNLLPVDFMPEVDPEEV